MQWKDRERLPHLQARPVEKISIRIVTAVLHNAVCSRERARVQLCRNHNANDDPPAVANIRISDRNMIWLWQEGTDSDSRFVLSQSY